MHSKKEIRSKTLKKRREMSLEEVDRLSDLIYEKIIHLPKYKLATDICAYISVNNEVKLDKIIEKALNDGKKVWLPRVIENDMIFYSYTRETELIKGNFNIPEPNSTEILNPDNKTLILMPGAVFSRNMDRIGYGGGYYDRYLCKFPMCYKVGVCYDFQILEDIPSEEFDIKPDIIISDRIERG